MLFAHKPTHLICFLCLLLLSSCQANDYTVGNQVEVKVTRVVSGQTLEVLGIPPQPNLAARVRLIGIDAPDFRQLPWADESKEVLAELIGEPEKSVILEFDLEAKDKTGRTLAYVWKDNRLLNEEIVKKGYALFVGRSPNHKYDRRLEQAQQWVRLMGKGIWNPEKPMRLSPSEFRRQKL